MAAVAAVDIGALDSDAGDALGLGDLCCQYVAVEGVARQAARTDHELPAKCGAVGGGERDLAAELKACAGLALADALHLWGVQGIDLLASAILVTLAQELLLTLQPLDLGVGYAKMESNLLDQHVADQAE